MAYVRVHLAHPYIDDDALTAQNSELFHYTSADALDRILSAGGLWATHYRRLSDESEFSLASESIANRIYLAKRKFLRREIERRPRVKNRIAKDGRTIEQVIRDDSQTIPRTIAKLSDKYTPMHVTSFAAHVRDHEKTGGILSLWREYGRIEGVAIRFDTGRLQAILSEIKARQKYHGLFLSKVTYGETDPTFIERVQGATGLEELYEVVARSIIAGKRAELPRSFEEEVAKFMVTSISHKHPSFEDEREIRLVASPLTTAEPFDRPVDEPDWLDRVEGSSRLLIRCVDAIDGVMIAPLCGQAEIEQKVLRILSMHGRVDVPVVHSDTPIRGRIVPVATNRAACP